MYKYQNTAHFRPQFQTFYKSYNTHIYINSNVTWGKTCHIFPIKTHNFLHRLLKALFNYISDIHTKWAIQNANKSRGLTMRLKQYVKFS